MARSDVSAAPAAPAGAGTKVFLGQPVKITSEQAVLRIALGAEFAEIDDGNYDKASEAPVEKPRGRSASSTRSRSGTTRGSERDGTFPLCVLMHNLFEIKTKLRRRSSGRPASAVRARRRAASRVYE